MNLAAPLISGGKVSEAISTRRGLPGCLVDCANGKTCLFGLEDSGFLSLV